MIFVDQLRKNDPRLRLLSVAVGGCLLILVAGLWWVQVVNRNEYQSRLETQSYLSMRIPAPRGKILDRNGYVLAENRPNYNLTLYLEDVRPLFGKTYDQKLEHARAFLAAEQKKYALQVGRELTPEEKRKFRVNRSQRAALGRSARYEATSNFVYRIGAALQRPIILNSNQFYRRYQASRAIPYPVLKDLSPAEVARFHERGLQRYGAGLEVVPVRSYPHRTLAAHLLGHLTRDDRSLEGEQAFFWYRLPDYRGVVGIEHAYDDQLRGAAGAKSVLVNNMRYRHTDTVWLPVEPGRHVHLTLDLEVQQTAETALKMFPSLPKGAVVVMEVETGDVLALASSPSFDPNHYIEGFPPGEQTRLNDPKLRPQINRATQENYHPGSIFKAVVGLACLEAGFNPNAKIAVTPDPQRPWRSCIYVGDAKFRDTAPPGDYDFKRALKLSSNSYFITNGLWAGIKRIAELGHRIHLGERIALSTRQETAGIFPSSERIAQHWYDGDTANICIGQGWISVTPLQMAVMTSAIANGGTVLWPRLVSRIESPDPLDIKPALTIAPGKARNHLGVSERNLQILREAMLADVEDSDGTGRYAAVAGLRICGKTGTAQIKNSRGQIIGTTTWFISFAPYEKPQYAVVVMVEDGESGGDHCAPMARDIYQVLLPRITGAATDLARNP